MRVGRRRPVLIWRAFSGDQPGAKSAISPLETNVFRALVDESVRLQAFLRFCAAAA
jgi:hypothetical protein